MPKTVKFDVFDPVHFHAALVFQSRYEGIGLEISPEVQVYHSRENPLNAFRAMLAKIEAERKGWKFHYHASDGPLTEMLEAKTGNALVLACPNNLKVNAIDEAIVRGYDLVLADKPWVIEPEGMQALKHAVRTATQNGTILQDIMTERHETGTIMQNLIMENEGLFGVIAMGTTSAPPIYKRSTHILDKSHLGVVRPPEYFDIAWQGEGIVDVTTHLVDMVNWLLMPEGVIHEGDISLVRATRSATVLQPEDFARITKGHEIREPLPYFCNGTICYTIDGTPVEVEVKWNLKGEDDEHYSSIQGTNVRIEVEKGPHDKHQKIYVTPQFSVSSEEVKDALDQHVRKLIMQGYGGAFVTEQKPRFELVLPQEAYTTHFQHFAQVTEQALGFLAGKPFQRDIEYSRLLAKYHLTIAALQMARKSQ